MNRSLNLPSLENLNEGGDMWRHGDVKQGNNRALGPPRPGHCYNCCYWWVYSKFRDQCAHVNQMSPRSHCVQSKWSGGWKKCNYCCEVWRLGKCRYGVRGRGCLDGPCVYHGHDHGLRCWG